MMAVAKRGSAKIMTPAADWIRWAQVREPDHQKEGILNLAVEPDDAGEAAEHLPLAALAGHANFGRDARIRSSSEHRRAVGRYAELAAFAPLEPRAAQFHQELRCVQQIGGIG